MPVCEASDAANATSVGFERGVHRSSRSCLLRNSRNTAGQLFQAHRGLVNRLPSNLRDRTGNNSRSKAYSTAVPQPQRQNAGSKTQSEQLSHACTALLSEGAASARAPEPLAPPASQAGISLSGLTCQHATASLQQAGQARPASCPAAYQDVHRSASASLTVTAPAAYSAAPRSSPAVQPSVLAAAPSRRHQGARQKASSHLSLPLGAPSQGPYQAYQAWSEPEGCTSDSHVPSTAAAAAASKGQSALHGSAAGVSESSTSTTISTESLLQVCLCLSHIFSRPRHVHDLSMLSPLSGRVQGEVRLVCDVGLDQPHAATCAEPAAQPGGAGLREHCRPAPADHQQDPTGRCTAPATGGCPLRGPTALPCRSWPGCSLLSCVRTCQTPMSTAVQILREHVWGARMP